jgi:hypothetical protein
VPTIVILLAATPLLTLSLLDGTAWSPETLVLGQLALAAAVVTVVVWVIMDAVLARGAPMVAVYLKALLG